MTIGLRYLLVGLLLAISAGGTAPLAAAQDKSAPKTAKESASVKRTHEQIVKALGLYDDQAIQDYVNEVGRKVAAQSELAGADFKFYVIDDDSINAFTTGCCRIYVNRGLLISLNSEAELAAVLGHEIGHVTGRHPQKQQRTGILTGLLAAGAAIASGSQIVADLANIAGTAAFRGYGRAQEMEADRFGMIYATKAGYRPEAMGEVFNMFKAGERFERDRARAEGREPRIYHGLFSTHPAPDQRAVQAAKGAARVGGDAAAFVDNREEYLRRIEGIAFGSSKAQGILRENRMYHAPLGITVAFPRGWTVENHPDKVVAYTPNKDAYVIMALIQADPKQRLTPREVLLRSVQGASWSGGEAIESHGMQGYTAVSRNGSYLDQGQGPVRYVVFERGNAYYIFAGASRASRGGIPEADGVILGVAQTLRSLRPSEFPLGEPYRIKILRATPGTQLADYASNVPLDKYQKEHLELINGLYPGRNPEPGQLFKVVE
ncbi:MAG: M48 family metalloprotease [Steroidobacteraceae bacterium]|nr:M48 family metalloprotease [Steroidobacteraceae bacterium]MDW8260738.1 M48 family metalloprotease [Gammaproteobacteria bacterium]